MSDYSDQGELLEELEHQRRMVNALRRRRRLLEHTHVIKGIETDPHILMQMEDISQQIKEREAEIIRLQTAAVEDKETLAEVEYRVAVAETFDTPQGVPSIAGNARLELLRLRLGIPIEQAKNIERAIRAALAVRELGSLTQRELDAISEVIRAHNSTANSSTQAQITELQWNKCINIYKKLERAFQLDAESATGWCGKIGRPQPEELRLLLHIGSIYFGHFTKQTMISFIRRLEKADSAP